MPNCLFLGQRLGSESCANPTANLNLGLQGNGVMRTETCTMERELKMASNLKGIQDLAKKHPQLKEEVSAAIESIKALLNTVFQRLHLKEKRFQMFPAASTEELQGLADHFKKIDHEFKILP